MKRLLFWLTGSSLVIVLGLIAIARGQRGTLKEAPVDEPARLAASEAAAVRPIPLDPHDRSTAADPFARRSRYRLDATEQASAAEPEAETAAPAEQADRGGSATRGADPFGLRSAGDEASGGYTERAPAASSDDAPAESTAEPRRLAEPDESSPADTGATDESAERNGATGRRAPAPAEPDNTAATDANPAPEEAVADQPTATEAPAPDSASSADAEGAGRPGGEQLQGPQSPTLTIEKLAPDEIQVGKPAVFTIKVRNTGTVVAHGVEVHDLVPKGTRLAGASPKATQVRPGELAWDLGSLKPGEEAGVELQLMPVAEGEIGSTATVTFRAEATVRTVATRPALALQVSGPDKVMIDQPVELAIKVSNPGSGAATGVILSEVVPSGLKHEAGNELEFEIGLLKPGESRELALTLTAAAAGAVQNVLRVRGDGNLAAEHVTELEVIAPDLKVAMTGPKKRYLERAATYNISVSNPGTATAREIELVTVLPRGLKFVNANNSGQYDAATHSVYWSLAELPAQESGSVTLTALPIEPGDLTLKIKGQAQQGLVDQKEETIVVEGLSAVQFEIADVNDPVELNGETVYEVRVTNQGSKAAANVQLTVQLPAELKFVTADGPVRYSVESQRVVFEALNQLAPKADTTYTLKVQALQAGDQRIRVQVLADDLRAPITKEESTRVYADE